MTNFILDKILLGKYEFLYTSLTTADITKRCIFLSSFMLIETIQTRLKSLDIASLRYYLNLVLVDEEERRYFKQQVYFSNPLS